MIFFAVTGKILTCNTDFLYRGADPDEALNELKRVAGIKLDDFLGYRFMAENQKYRDGYRVVFSVCSAFDLIRSCPLYCTHKMRGEAKMAS